MASQFYLRMGAGNYAYVCINRQSGAWDMAASDNHNKVFITHMTRKEWGTQYPELLEKGQLEICKENTPPKTKRKRRKLESRRSKNT